VSLCNRLLGVFVFGFGFGLNFQVLRLGLGFALAFCKSLALASNAMALALVLNTKSLMTSVVDAWLQTARRARQVSSRVMTAAASRSDVSVTEFQTVPTARTNTAVVSTFIYICLSICLSVCRLLCCTIADPDRSVRALSPCSSPFFTASVRGTGVELPGNGVGLPVRRKLC